MAWDELALLADPVRRGLYEHVRRQGGPVTREEAAEARGISRGLAAFHLDKLVDGGMLSARYSPPEDQPRGRGRAPKVYEYTGHATQLTIPPRNYELIGAILAEAVADQPDDAANAAATRARRSGAELGRKYPGIDRALDELGFEPDRECERVILRNCPFHGLAARHPELVCALNLAFVEGLLDGTRSGGEMTAHLAPRPDACCVELHRAELDRES